MPRDKELVIPWPAFGLPPIMFIAAEAILFIGGSLRSSTGYQRL